MREREREREREGQIRVKEAPHKTLTDVIILVSIVLVSKRCTGRPPRLDRNAAADL